MKYDILKYTLYFFSHTIEISRRCLISSPSCSSVSMHNSISFKHIFVFFLRWNALPISIFIMIIRCQEDEIVMKISEDLLWDGIDLVTYKSRWGLVGEPIVSCPVDQVRIMMIELIALPYAACNCIYSSTNVFVYFCRGKKRINPPCCSVAPVSEVSRGCLGSPVLKFYHFCLSVYLLWANYGGGDWERGSGL